MNLLHTLPEPETLKRLMKAHAALNIVLCPEEWLRYHRFIPDWDENISMAQIDNGAGDHLFIIFAPQGTILKGFDHESELSPHTRDDHSSWPGIYESTPKTLLSLLEDEAIEIEDVTFCLWRESSDSAWHKGKVEIPDGETDGSGFLLGTIYRTPEDFVEFAKGYFELELSLAVVANIYDGVPITEEMIQLLNPDCNIEDALQELALLQ